MKHLQKPFRLLCGVALILLFCNSLYASVAPSGTLPVLYIETAGHAPISTKTDYVQATYQLDAMGIAGIEDIGTADAPLGLQIRGRGNWTWSGFDKKPYRLKLAAKAGLLGLKKSKHFALLAHADDNKGFLRNTVGFRLSELLGLAWTPKQAPVEVVLNGDYIGLYFLTETIRVDKDRVNIVEQADMTEDADSITGGWLVEIDNYDSDPHVEITEGDGARIIFTYKTPEVLSAAQERFLTEEMTRLNTLIYGDKESDELWDYLDLDALARFYIVQEVTDNYESFHGSCYLHRDMGAGKKWVFGPVWDFGSAFNYEKNQYCWQGREHHMTWIGEICKFPRFMSRVEEIWHGFADEGYGELESYIDGFASQIAAAARQDAERWPEYGNTDAEAKAAHVKHLLEGAEGWLTQQWGRRDSEWWTVWFTDNGSPAWTDVHCFVWDANATGYTNGVYAPLGDWCGRRMERKYVGDTEYYTLTFRADYPLSAEAGIIFNNHASGKPANQTEDLPLKNNAVYNREGIIGEITALEQPADDSETAVPVYYNLQGMRVETPQRGHIYIVQHGQKTEKRLF